MSSVSPTSHRAGQSALRFLSPHLACNRPLSGEGPVWPSIDHHYWEGLGGGTIVMNRQIGKGRPCCMLSTLYFGWWYPKHLLLKSPDEQMHALWRCVIYLIWSIVKIDVTWICGWSLYTRVGNQQMVFWSHQQVMDLDDLMIIDLFGEFGALPL